MRQRKASNNGRPESGNETLEISCNELNDENFLRIMAILISSFEIG